ncbi:hypothetical protein GLOIN_2v1875692 [Rhizophagus irregularis DAOM 181602=DAOM 197198]|uniref:Uncharacterized protein n=1 Tax=Rhizophagus irregularis (strain DAOM 181602 / DAOM 197198 / MUCL 43194) TaxID=747089 RepID=A0A2P4Q2B6_RHIID|nr:hypothetical protein GLOIN_2v1602177 [Rhizophagus irregularis DAOM 181602=DAOM 197198]POG71732.1 hypothetical protein GLOIN_2v1875692 [Rhizophagus irregularis DAOM 181602=DAOM 197198]|eukprot:XP_025178598.1 hypothetical protein GLOIN_2v1602177 [Rhizophagus irregularis DAOM 181602=DAOM 197198]
MFCFLSTFIEKINLFSRVSVNLRTLLILRKVQEEKLFYFKEKYFLYTDYFFFYSIYC